MKKGFTLVELLAVIAIMAVLLLIAVPVYNNVQNSINESVYTTKIQRLKSASETYAEENGSFIFDVKTLVEAGKIEADNERGDYIDPRTNRNMNCDIINVIYDNNQYSSNITENDTCVDSEELQSLYGLVDLVIYRNNEEISLTDGWTTGSIIDVRYRFKEDYANYNDSVEELTWLGEETKTCTKENITDCASYTITTGEIKSLTVTLNLKVVKDGMEINNTVKKMISIDNQAPYIIDGSIVPNSELNSQSQRRMEFDLSDGDGSGIAEYAVINSSFACDSEEYNTNKKVTNDTHITEYLSNGDYRICVRDKVGNRNANENNTFVVSNVDTGAPVINVFTISSQESNYHTSLANVLITVTDDGGTDNLQMCVSEKGYLQDCSWEDLDESFEFDFKELDGDKRTLYLSIQDEAGNIDQRIAEYTPYENCSSQKKVMVDASWSSCSKTCGGGTQTKRYQMIDEYTEKVCNTGNDSQACNTQMCCPSISFSVDSSTAGYNGWYRALTLRGTVSDASVVNRVQYCNTTGSSCTPSTNVGLSGNIFRNTLSTNYNQKICARVITKDNQTCGTSCSGGFSVDTIAPSARISTSCNGSNVMVSANGSSDGNSGVRMYYYSKDNVNWVSSTSSSYTFANTNSGTFYVKVQDYAGNMSSTVSQARTCRPTTATCGNMNATYDYANDRMTLTVNYNYSNVSKYRWGEFFVRMIIADENQQINSYTGDGQSSLYTNCSGDISNRYNAGCDTYSSDNNYAQHVFIACNTASSSCYSSSRHSSILVAGDGYNQNGTRNYENLTVRHLYTIDTGRIDNRYRHQRQVIVDNMTITGSLGANCVTSSSNRARATCNISYSVTMVFQGFNYRETQGPQSGDEAYVTHNRKTLADVIPTNIAFGLFYEYDEDDDDYTSLKAFENNNVYQCFKNIMID